MQESTMLYTTAILVCQGHVYGLDPHLDRLWRSAEKARIEIPLSKSELRERVLWTVAATKRYYRMLSRFDMNG